MQTIKDGMIKADFVHHLQKCDVRGVAEASAALVARRQQRMIIDACMEVVHYVNPAYAFALLKLFKSCNTVDRTCKMVTLCFRGINEADGDVTPVDDKVSDTIAAIIRRSETRTVPHVEMLKALPLKIGKKWRGIASCCVRVIKERVPQRDHDASPDLLALLTGEVPASKKALALESEVDDEERRIEEIKLGVMWTYTRGPRSEEAIRSVAMEPEEKVVTYDGKHDPEVGGGQHGVLHLS